MQGKCEEYAKGGKDKSTIEDIHSNQSEEVAKLKSNFYIMRFKYMIEDIMNLRNEMCEIKRDNRELAQEKENNKGNLDKLQIQLKNVEKDLESTKFQLKSINHIIKITRFTRAEY